MCIRAGCRRHGHCSRSASSAGARRVRCSGKYLMACASLPAHSERKEGHLRAGNWAKRGFYAGRWSLISPQTAPHFLVPTLSGAERSPGPIRRFSVLTCRCLTERQWWFCCRVRTIQPLKRCRIFCGPWQSRLKKASSSMALTTVIPAGLLFPIHQKKHAPHIRPGLTMTGWRELRFIRGDAPSVFIRTRQGRPY